MAKHIPGPLVLAFAAVLALGAGTAAALAAVAPDQRPGPTGQEPAMTLVQPLLDATAGELADRALLNVRREKLGTVEMIARSRQDRTLSAIVRVGGWFGFGGTLVAVPLDRVYPRGNSMILFEPLTEEQLRQMENYREDRYEVIAGDTRLGDLEGIAPSPQPPQVTFSDMDRDGDGYITPLEAQSQLLEAWGEFDRNGDNRIDRSEFSAFEEQMAEPVPEV